MKKQNDPIYDTLIDVFSARIKECYPEVDLEAFPWKKLIAPPPKFEMGDFALGCFPLAKSCKKAPAQVAQELAKEWQHPILQEVTAAGPYLNIKCLPEFYGRSFFEHWITPSAKWESNLPRPKIMVEYSQPNTHKELHVGHMRNLALGNSLIKLIRFCGQNVLSATYPGDVGTHVSKCLWYMKNINQEAPPEEAIPRAQWLGRMYSLAEAHLQQLSEDEQKKVKQEMATILKQIESSSGEYFDLWSKTREWSIYLMKETYKWSEVEFDHWYFESQMDAPSLTYAKKLLNDGVLVKDEGAIGMDLSQEKLGFCMLIKSDGNGLYATKDIELARVKFEEHKIDKNIYIVDTRQSFHFKQVFKTLEKIGFPQAKDCLHLAYDFVELKEGAMSSRKGNVVPLLDLIKKMEEKIFHDYLGRYKEEWSEEERKHVATQVARGAIFYGMLQMDPGKKIVFDMDEWLRLDGESGPYIQYVATRIQSLLKKFPLPQDSALNWSKLTLESERKLFVLLADFYKTIETATETYRPSHVCKYLYDISKSFNSFYAEAPIGKESHDEIKQARLTLAHITLLVLIKGLDLLGIPTPNKM